VALAISAEAVTPAFLFSAARDLPWPGRFVFVFAMLEL
jgi:hypothetical protein